MITITYFVHGTTTDNEKHISSGWYDVALSPKGVQQSIDLRGDTKDKHFDAVFCSDLKRATESARLMFENSSVIIPDRRLRECNYGTYNAQPSAVVEPLQAQSITVPFSGGESYEDVKTRIADFLEYLRREHPGGSVAIVAHKAPQLALDVILKAKTWRQAFDEDWRKTGLWQAGWEYIIE